MWYYPKGITNILSLHKVQKKYKVTYNSTMMTGFVVHKPDDTSHMFKYLKKGLFFSDAKCDIAQLIVNTVDSIKNKLSVTSLSKT